MSYSTTDTAFAAWIAWKKKYPVIPRPKVRGRASFIIHDIDEIEGANLRLEYESSEFFEFDSRRRSLTLQIPDE